MFRFFHNIQYLIWKSIWYFGSHILISFLVSIPAVFCWSYRCWRVVVCFLVRCWWCCFCFCFLLFACCFLLSGWQLDRVRVLVICSLKTRCKLSDKAYFINLSHKRWPLWMPACSSFLALHTPAPNIPRSPILDPQNTPTIRLPVLAPQNRFRFRISSIPGTNLLPS